jgi:hypothetical protein
VATCPDCLAKKQQKLFDFAAACASDRGIGYLKNIYSANTIIDVVDPDPESNWFFVVVKSNWTYCIPRNGTSVSPSVFGPVDHFNSVYPNHKLQY